MNETLLIIEDEKLLGAELSRHFQNSGWEVEWVTTLKDASTLLLNKKISPLIVLSDMNLPDGNALNFMENMKKNIRFGEWIFLTGYGSVPDSVRALRLGAYDFLEKPCDLDRLDLIIASATRGATYQRRICEQTETRHLRYTPEAYVGHSPQSQAIRHMLAKLTQVPFSALVIGGESGTGKGLSARILHYSGPRAKQPLIEVNCAALPRDLMESELFGHEAGAFTGATSRHRGLLEQADGGTLFMDEIGDMPLDLQTKLLKVIEDKKIRRLGSEKEITVDVQITAASNRNLEKLLQTGEFRADLYHRLSVFKITLPPLRMVIDDLDELVPVFVAEYNAKAGRQVKTIPSEVWKKLKAHHWQGNVRELRNVIERCVLFADNEIFPEQWLNLPQKNQHDSNTVIPLDEKGIQLQLDGSMALDDIERYIIKATLDQTRHNLAAAARVLGTTRETLRYRVRKYNL